MSTYFIFLSNLATEVLCKALLVVLNASYLLEKKKKKGKLLPECALKEKKKEGRGGGGGNCRLVAVPVLIVFMVVIE